LHDRGKIEQGLRADLVLIDAAPGFRPRVIAALVGGRIVHLTEPERIVG
jgi:alpha-D-ribose 1-methylphosphonate 5-triphosphate diphosphatase